MEGGRCGGWLGDVMCWVASVADPSRRDGFSMSDPSARYDLVCPRQAYWALNAPLITPVVLATGRAGEVGAWVCFYVAGE